MNSNYLTPAAALLLCLLASAPARTQQPAPRPTPAPARTQATPQPSAQAPRAAGFDLSDYGVRIEPDARLVVVMAALDAAGWEPTPGGGRPSPFRETVRKGHAGLDPALRTRLQDFYRRNKLPETATPAEQAARYVSLALALGPAPTLSAPPRSEDLPSAVLEVLDFAPLVREFYAGAGFEERLPEYLKAYRAEGERLRRPTAEMIRSALSYLHTQPVTTILERVPAPASQQKQQQKKDGQQRPPTVRERERRFLLVPDLLAAPGAINFRVIGDDYFAVVPEGIDPASSEVRRAYVQYLVDPLVLRFNRDVAARRQQIKQLLDAERERKGGDITPDVFLSVARSLVVAADARMSEAARLAALQSETSARLQRARDEAGRAVVVKDSQAQRRAIEDATTAQLAEGYERGAVLAFHFAEQLRGLETSGFDIASFVSDMVGAIDPAREGRRPAEYAEAVKRHTEARRRAFELAAAAEADDSPAAARRAALVRSLTEVDALLRQKNYTEAEARLRQLAQEHQGEPRVLFALAQAASLSAQDAFDPTLQSERLNRALSLYRQTVLAASPDADRALIFRAHAASGRILAFLERTDEAIKEFDAALAVGDAADPAYVEVAAERKRLAGQK